MIRFVLLLAAGVNVRKETHHRLCYTHASLSYNRSLKVLQIFAT